MYNHTEKAMRKSDDYKQSSDDEIATVGTVNFDFRSLYLHFENGCLFYKSSIVDQVKEDFLDTQQYGN